MTITHTSANMAKIPPVPLVPDFCPACDTVGQPFHDVTRLVEQEFRGKTLEVEAPAMRCRNCGFEIAGPGHLESLRNATLEQAGL